MRDVLVGDVPDCVAQTFEYARRLRDVEAALALVLSVDDVSENPYLVTNDGIAHVRTLRDALVDTSLVHAEFLGNARIGHSTSGWTLLMVSWYVVAQLTVCLALLTVDDDDDDDDVDDALLTTAGGVDDVAAYSVGELRLALDVVRDALENVVDVTPALVRFVGALERRAAVFVIGAGGDDARDYDDAEWMRERQPTNAFVATAAWTFTWAKRVLATYVRMSTGAFYSSALTTGTYVRLETTTITTRTPTRATLLRVASTLHTKDHEAAFQAVALPQAVHLSELEVHTYVHGMGGLETATYRDVLERRRSPEAVVYLTTRKFRRPLVEFLDAEGPDRPLRELAALYTAQAYFRSALPDWAQRFVVRLHVAREHFETAVRQNIATGLPFLVQRLGRCACIVPPLPESSLVSRTRIERTLGLASPSEGVGCAAYDAECVVDALGIWARFMLDAWDGRIASAPLVRLGPLLRPLVE